MKTGTEHARRALPDMLEGLLISRKLQDAERERRFCIAVCRHLAALKRSQNASEAALAARMDRFVFDRDYDAAIQAWEGRR